LQKLLTVDSYLVSVQLSFTLDVFDGRVAVWRRKLLWIHAYDQYVIMRLVISVSLIDF